jgi:hypothetical protein
MPNSRRRSSFIQVAGVVFEFGDALRPAIGVSQECHRLFNYA